MASSVAPVKRKAEKTPITEGDNVPPSVNGSKKLKKEWKCTLCQVTAYSEQALQDHLNGKKHKKKEKALSKTILSASDNLQAIMAEGTGDSGEQTLPTSNGKPEPKKFSEENLHDVMIALDTGDFKVTSVDGAEEKHGAASPEIGGGPGGEQKERRNRWMMLLMKQLEMMITRWKRLLSSLASFLLECRHPSLALLYNSMPIFSLFGWFVNPERPLL